MKSGFVKSFHGFGGVGLCYMGLSATVFAIVQFIVAGLHRLQDVQKESDRMNRKD